MLYLAAVIQVSARGVRGEMWRVESVECGGASCVWLACESGRVSSSCGACRVAVVWRVVSVSAVFCLRREFSTRRRGQLLALMAKTIANASREMASRARQPTTFEDLLMHKAASQLQHNFRRVLARRAASQARRLLIDENLLWRLAAVCARTEDRAASLIQSQWRLIHKRKNFQGRLAVKRIGNALLSHKANKVANELKQRARQEQKELEAAIRLQAALRRSLARRYAAYATRKKAIGLVRTKLAKSRGERAVGHVQRAWVAKVARKREIEARTQAATAEQLALRLARARAADLRTQHFATLIARHLRQFVQRRLRVAGSLRGWLAKRVQHKGAVINPWRRRYFWVAGGAILYDSVKWRTARSRGLPIRELSEAVRIRPNTSTDFELRFQRGIVRRTLSLRAAEASEADFWRRSLLWLAKLADAPPRAPLSAVHPAGPSAPPQSPNAGRGGGGQQPAALLTALGSLEAGGPNAEQQNAQTLRELMLKRAAARANAKTPDRGSVDLRAPPPMTPSSAGGTSTFQTPHYV